MIIVSNSNYINVTIFLGFVTLAYFNEMYEVTKGAWPSDIAKEMFDTNLKVYCRLAKSVQLLWFWPDQFYLKVKAKFHFYKRQVINKVLV